MLVYPNLYFYLNYLSLHSIVRLSSATKTSKSYFSSDEDKARNKDKEPLEGLGGPMTRVRTKKVKEALQQVLIMLFEFKPKLQLEKLRIVNCTMFQEEYRVSLLLSDFISILLVEIKAQTCVKVAVNSLWICTTHGLVLI